MGRWSFSSKQEVDYLKKIEVWWLKKYGYLNGWKYGGIEWKHSSGDKHSIGIEVSLIGNLKQKEERKRYFDGEDISSLSKFVRFFYTQTEPNGEKKKFDYKVLLTTTPCNYGGVRYWFICPLSKNGVYCGKRVGVLYKAGDYFGCRHCYDLTYSSRNENRGYKNYPLFFWIKSWKRIEDLEQKIKRPYYKGKPTRKQRRLEKIEMQMIPYIDLIKRGAL